MSSHVVPAESVNMSALLAGHDSPESRMDALFPWLSSFMLHVGVGLLLCFTAFAVGSAIKAAEDPASLGRSTGGVLEPAPRFSVDQEGHPGFGGLDRPASQTDFDGHIDGWDPKGRLDFDLKSLAGMTAGDLGDKVIGRSARVYTGGLGGEGNGLGKGLPGRLARRGDMNSPGGEGLFGVGVPRCPRTVYILDHSGSMLDTFDHLRSEVKTRIANFRPYQQFAVIVFSEDAQVLGPARLQHAFPEVRQAMSAALDGVQAQGRNDDTLPPFQSAFEKAFALRPAQIIFLTDGRFDPRLMEVVAKLNRDKKVTISTIAFVGTDQEYQKQLQEMAKAHGGQFKFVSAEELQKR